MDSLFPVVSGVPVVPLSLRILKLQVYQMNVAEPYQSSINFIHLLDVVSVEVNYCSGYSFTWLSRNGTKQSATFEEIVAHSEQESLQGEQVAKALTDVKKRGDNALEDYRKSLCWLVRILFEIKLFFTRFFECLFRCSNQKKDFSLPQRMLTVTDQKSTGKKHVRHFDLALLQVFSSHFIDLSVIHCVCKHWKQLAGESTIPRPLTSDLNGDNTVQNCFMLSIANISRAGDIADVVVTAFGTGDVFRKVGQRRTSKQEVIQEMQTPNNRWYIVTHKARIVATVLYTADSPSEASIHMLAAHPDYWKQKLGTLLLRKAEAAAREQGKKNLNLSSAQCNDRLKKFYERHGFRQTEGCQEEEYFSPELQQEYLKPEFQGYEASGKAKLRSYEMTKSLVTASSTSKAAP